MQGSQHYLIVVFKLDKQISGFTCLEGQQNI